MMVILPEWFSEAEEKLDKVVNEISFKNHLDCSFVDDSKSIDNAKKTILYSLVHIYEEVNVEERERIEKCFNEIKKSVKKEKQNKTKKVKRRKTSSRKNKK